MDAHAPAASRALHVAFAVAFAVATRGTPAKADATPADAGPDAGATAPPSAVPGDARVLAPRRTVRETPNLPAACGFRHRVCVRGARDAPRALATLAALERALDVLTGALGLPAPDPGVESGAFDVWLEDGAPRLGDVALDAFDPVARFDRASAVGTLDARLGPGCTLDLAAARVAAGAVLARVAPATDPGTALAETTYLASLVAPCERTALAESVAAYQARPHAFVADRRDAGASEDFDPFAPLARAARPSVRAHAYATGAALGVAWLDGRHGAEPGRLLAATWALRPTPSTPAPRYHSEPDTLDVLAGSAERFYGRRARLDDHAVDLGAARATAGALGAYASFPAWRGLGPALDPHLDWDVPFPTTPRRLAAAAPVAPLGSAFVVVRTAGAPPGARLRVEVEWEAFARMTWRALRLDAAGRELARQVFPSSERATSAQGTVADLAGTAAVLLVGTSGGDPSARLDPDDGVFEPHGFLLSVAGL